MEKTYSLKKFLKFKLLALTFILFTPFVYKVKSQIITNRIFNSSSLQPVSPSTPVGNSNSQPQYITNGDLNNDGKIDVIVSNGGAGQNGISIFPNSTSSPGSITFDHVISLPTGYAPNGVATADFDGDSKLDIVAAIGNPGNIHIYKNISNIGGSISFDNNIQIFPSVYPTFVATGDINSDGKIDIAVVNYDFYNPTITIFENTSTVGNINFNPLTPITVGPTNSLPNSLAIGDLDNDGKQDIVVINGNVSTNQILVLHNTSSGSTTSFTNYNYTTFGVQPSSIQIADIDADGKKDLIYSTSQGLAILQNKTSTQTPIDFEQEDIGIMNSGFGLLAADLDGDSKLDLISSRALNTDISIVRNKAVSGTIDGNSFTSQVVFNTGKTRTYGIIVADLDNDGKPDIGSVNQNNSGFDVAILRNTIDDTPPVAPVNLSIKAGSTQNILKWNANVEFDLASYKIYWGTSPNPTTPLATVNKPTTTYTHTGLTNGTTYYYKITAVDNVINESAYSNEVSAAPQFPPIITSFTPMAAPAGAQITITGNNFNTIPANNIVFFGGVRAQVNTATATQLQVVVPAGTTNKPITVLNAATELIGYSSNSFKTTYNNAVGKSFDVNSFSTSQAFTLNNQSPSSLKAADFDGDGKLDIAISYASGGSNVISIYHNGSTFNKIDITTKTSFNLAIEDIDGDGKLDLIAPSSNGSGIDILLNNSSPGSISFATIKTIPSSTNIYSIKVQDLDLDGKPDIVVGYTNTGNLTVFRNITTDIGDVKFKAGENFALTLSPGFIQIRDFNGDNKPDIVCGSNSASSIAVLINQSTSGVIDANSFAQPNYISVDFFLLDMEESDLDGDGMSDLVITYASTGLQYITVLKNNSTINQVSFSKQNLPVSIGPSGSLLTINDLDGDGKLDIVAGIDNTNVLFRNSSTTSNISFENAVQIPVAKVISGARYTPISADFDNDGQADLAWISFANELRIAKNTIDNIAPATPTGLTVTLGNLQSVLNWNANTEIDLAGYKIYGGTSANPTTLLATVNAPNITYTQTGLTAGNTYYYRISAIDQNGNESAISTDVSVNVKLNQTITFAAINPVVFGTADFNPGATSTNTTIPITYTSSDPNVATIVNGQIHVVGVGTTTITASQAGNNVYNAAANVTQQLTVTKAIQTITFAATKSVVFGTADFNPGATSTNTTIPVTYTSSNTNVATIVNGQIHIVGVGTATITASQAGDNTYSPAANVTQQLTVTQASQTITFAAINPVVFGTADFNPGAISTNTTIPVTYSSSDLNVATIVNGQIHIVGAGTTTITASQAGNTNYSAATSVTQQLTVTKATQTITFNTIPDQVLGSTDYTLNATTTSGLAVVYTSDNTNVVTIVNGKLHTVGAGTANITASQIGDQNYLAATPVVRSVRVTNDPTVVPNNILTPNGDGKNDTWNIKNIEAYASNEITIYDRAGRTVYHKKGYNNDWDGSYNGNPLEENTYYYILKLGSDKAPIKGFITLIRNNK